MFRKTFAVALLLGATAPAALAQDAPAPLTPEQAAMKAHVMFLASDAMQGREAGTEAYNIAAAYVASQFFAQGLVPAGDAGSYLQKVPLVSFKPADKGSFTLDRKGARTALVFGEDFLPGTDPGKDTTVVTAPVVFVGYGIDAPEFGRNDYKGVDVKGKIVAFLGGTPGDLPSEPRAHLGRVGKIEAAAKRGAIGTITLESPITARVAPFARRVGGWDGIRMTWMNPDGTGHVDAAGTPGLGSFSLAGAAKLFEGARTPWAKVLAQAEDPNAKFKAEQLPGTLTVALKTETRPATSYNVAGMLPGSDPGLKDEVVVLTAHLDHVGIGRPNAKGDTIYNGAMDNAVGIASLIEEAKRFKASGKAPRRSILFLAVTAEEKGLVGSQYFAFNPTVPKAGLAANVNLDMPILTYRFEDVIAFGADRSSLGPIVRKAAEEIGVGFSADPMPEQSLFVRSDHYRFVQQGIPSVFLWPGHGGPGKAGTEHFFANHYHQASDQIDQLPAIDWSSGVRFIDVNYRIARAIADADQRPVWNKGDYFGTLYKGPMAK